MSSEHSDSSISGNGPDLDQGEMAIPSGEGIDLEAVERRPLASPIGLVVQAHGITADLDEGGMFARLADRLADHGLVSVRFSFRAHGCSGGRSEELTVAGEVQDLTAVVTAATARDPGLPLFVVAASFGAVPTLLAQEFLTTKGLNAMVLWNPVLDLRRTFLEPELPWGLANFNPAAFAMLRDGGYLDIDGAYRLGAPIFEEFEVLDPRSAFVAGGVQALVVHGDHDTYVSYDVARLACAERPDCEFHTVAGSDHGFDSREREDEAIAVTVGWLTNLSAPVRDQP
jgi:alpha/beta superfamily hydrolase